MRTIIASAFIAVISASFAWSQDWGFDTGTDDSDLLESDDSTTLQTLPSLPTLPSLAKLPTFSDDSGADTDVIDDWPQTRRTTYTAPLTLFKTRERDERQEKFGFDGDSTPNLLDDDLYQTPTRKNHTEDRGRYLGRLSANELDPESTGNPLGAGSSLDPNSIRNPIGKYGSEISPYSVNNPLATDAPKLYDSKGNYRGKLSSNPLDPDSVSNPLGRYGSPLSPDSINNPLGAGNPLSTDSPRKPLGKGLSIYGDE